MAELFANYLKVDRAPRRPRLLRLLAASIVLHTIAVGFALYVPAVRSALNLAGAFSGVQYVDEAYNKTAIGERADIINISDRFKYPEGYFAPTDAAMPGARGSAPETFDPFAPKIISEYKPEPEARLPKSKATHATVPKPAPSATPTPNIADGKSPSDVEAEKQLDKLAAENQIRRPRAINKKPFTEWLANAKLLKDRGALDLSGKTEITVEADREPNGKLRNVEVVQKTGDPKLTQLAKDLIAAVSDSGALDFLDGTQHLRMTFKLSDKEVTAIALTEMESIEQASQKASGYQAALALAGLLRGGRDEAIIYKSTKVSSNGRQVILNFTMPRADAGVVLSKQLPTS